MKRLYYWRGQAPHFGTNLNFGDRLNWTMLFHAGAEFDWAHPENADLVMIGSILEHLPEGWTGTVCGAGKLLEDSKVDLSEANVLAVRGKLTAAGCRGVPRDVVLGDPALLTPIWFPAQHAEYELGVVPHWSDQELWPRFNYGQIIDVTEHPEKVIAEITKCKRIVTTSLHAAIVADAFGIPRRLEYFPQVVNGEGKLGGDFKYRDYASIFDGDPHFGEFWKPPYKDVVKVQDDLRRALAQALGEEWNPPAQAALPKPKWWKRICWPCRRPQVSMLVPFRDDGEYRTQAWNWLRQYWEWNLPSSVEIVMGTDTRTPFSKAEAVNDAARRARGKVFIICDADAYMDSADLMECVKKIQAALRAKKRLWFMPYSKLYRLNQTATLAVLGTDPIEPYWMPHPPPDSWLEPGNDPSGGQSCNYGHRYGAMVMVMPREAFEMVNGMDYRMAGWGSEDVSFLRALDTLYCQHEVADNDLCHLWHLRPGLGPMTRKWVGQRVGMANSRLAQRYLYAAGEPAFMKALTREYEPWWKR